MNLEKHFQTAPSDMFQNNKVNINTAEEEKKKKGEAKTVCSLCARPVDLQPWRWLKGQRRLKERMRRQRRGEKVWFHLQVAVKDVSLTGSYRFSPKLETTKSSAQSSPSDQRTWSGDPDGPNRPRAVMSASVFTVGIHSGFFWTRKNSCVAQMQTKY